MMGSISRHKTAAHKKTLKVVPNADLSDADIVWVGGMLWPKLSATHSLIVNCKLYRNILHLENVKTLVTEIIK